MSRLRPALAALALLALGATAPPPALVRVTGPTPVFVAAAPPPAAETGLAVTAEQPARAALLAAGVPVDQVNGALFALSEEVDVLRTAPGDAWRVGLAHDGATGAAALRSLTHVARGRTVTVRRDEDGSYAVVRPKTAAAEPSPEPPSADERGGGEPVVVSGPVEEVLYGLGHGEQVPPLVLYRAVRVFGHRLDLAREVALGDRVRLIYLREPRPMGGVASGDLIYAELVHDGRASRFYRGDESGDTSAFFDADGGALSGYLLRTPVDNPRVTSGFGLRLHPLLGYTRMHRGVDFGAPSGTPVVAAADGEVESALWAGGYGRFLKIRHAGGWATGYGHLSAWAPGMTAGAHVRQGQVVAYVGATGLATGPHLHYEVYRDGAAVDPATVAQIAARPRLRSARFEAVKRRVADLLAHAPSVRADAPRDAGDGPLPSRTTSLGGG